VFGFAFPSFSSVVSFLYLSFCILNQIYILFISNIPPLLLLACVISSQHGIESVSNEEDHSGSVSGPESEGCLGVSQVVAKDDIRCLPYVDYSCLVDPSEESDVGDGHDQVPQDQYVHENGLVDVPHVSHDQQEGRDDAGHANVDTDSNQGTIEVSVSNIVPVGESAGSDCEGSMQG